MISRGNSVVQGGIDLIFCRENLNARGRFIGKLHPPTEEFLFYPFQCTFFSGRSFLYFAGDQGLIAVTMVFCHITILVFDSILIPVWVHLEKRYKKKKEGENDGIEVQNQDLMEKSPLNTVA